MICDIEDERKGVEAEIVSHFATGMQVNGPVNKLVRRLKVYYADAVIVRGTMNDDDYGNVHYF
ncbi:hypothetical protein BWQ96_07362 [Gracilariopsis chorda]|uniref:Uncharacterized protein n=1 Tax=Gracilariopsis chorda TaxID=448386 RepID=A0A2V3ILF9_9FLOR|nr:hypothetical protein BWQ96_07362 [Gracilariopsis chorda]|eukprot:PXF42915.1 hypothetical protein BWQ96_07362 [Gracilariopsis chorda]